jgi:recombination protein RecT
MSVPEVTQKPQTTLAIIKGYTENETVKKRFAEVLGDKASQFLASISSLVTSQVNFNGVDPNTIMSSAMVAATLDLPINPNLGFAYIIPYNSKNGKQAQFQIGYKGFLQLALRSGQFKTINATEVYEGEIIGLNRLTGELTLDQEKKKSDTIVGYAAYFRLVNGFEKTLYMTEDQITAHAEKFSKSYGSDNSIWKKDRHSMALKTVLKMLLSKYGILSVNMQKAIEVDQAVINNDGNAEYVDAVEDTTAEPNASDALAAKAKEALAKQSKPKPTPPVAATNPADDIAAKSAKLKSTMIDLISATVSRETLGDITRKVEQMEIVKEDYSEIIAAIDAREEELLKVKK